MKRKSQTNKSVNLKLKLLAFSLADIIITLGLIGMGLEIVVSKYVEHEQKLAYVAELKTAYTEINQTLIQIGSESNSTGSLARTGIFVGTAKDVGKKLSKHFRTARICGNTSKTGCFANNVSDSYNGISKRVDYDDTSNKPGYKFILKSGASILLETPEKGDGSCRDFLDGGHSNGTTHNLDKVCGRFLIDVNGPEKGPNNMGRDIFIFSISDGKGPFLYPLGGPDDADWANKGYCRGFDSTGYTCGARIIKEDWQMNY